MSRAVIAISKCIVMGFHSISDSEHVAAYKGKKVFSEKKPSCDCSRSKQMPQTDQINVIVQPVRTFFWVTWYMYPVLGPFFNPYLICVLFPTGFLLFKLSLLFAPFWNCRRWSLAKSFGWGTGADIDFPTGGGGRQGCSWGPYTFLSMFPLESQGVPKRLIWHKSRMLFLDGFDWAVVFY